MPYVVELMNGYKRLLMEVEPTDGDDANYKVIVVVLTDLSADRAQGVFADVLQQLAVPSYVENGIMFGPFYEGNQGTALYNPSFRPFQSAVPFLFVRQGVISDWKFFVDNQEWLNYWAPRFGESAVHALAEELRRLPWRARRDEGHRRIGVQAWRHQFASLTTSRATWPLSLIRARRPWRGGGSGDSCPLPPKTRGRAKCGSLFRTPVRPCASGAPREQFHQFDDMHFHDRRML